MGDSVVRNRKIVMDAFPNALAEVHLNEGLVAALKTGSSLLSLAETALAVQAENIVICWNVAWCTGGVETDHSNATWSIVDVVDGDTILAGRDSYLHICKDSFYFITWDGDGLDNDAWYYTGCMSLEQLLSEWGSDETPVTEVDDEQN